MDFIQAQNICKLMIHRDQLGDLLNVLGLFVEGIEIGRDVGWYSYAILSRWQGKKLHQIDPYEQYTEYTSDHLNKPSEHQEWRLLQADRRLEPWVTGTPCYEFHRMRSDKAVELFTDGSLDFVYIDGNHSYNYCLKDLEMYTPKVKAGGLVLCHDYSDTDLPSLNIKHAVNRFTEKNGYTFLLTSDKPQTAFFVKTH